MCVISMIMDDWNKKFPQNYPYIEWDPPKQTDWTITTNADLSELKEDVKKLKKEVQHLVKLLKAARS